MKRRRKFLWRQYEKGVFGQKISTNFYYLSLLFQLSVAYSENFKEIKVWEVLKILKEKIGILPIYFAWRKKLIVFTLCQVCTLYENSIT